LGEVLSLAFGAEAGADGTSAVEDPGVIVGELLHPPQARAKIIASLLNVFSIFWSRVGIGGGGYPG